MKRLQAFLLDLTCLVFIIGFIEIFIPYQKAVIFNPDEGLEAIKAILFDAGYSLYSEIWSDQPPGYTILLTLWHNLFGNTISDYRFLTILFSALLLISFRRIIAIHFGKIVSVYAISSLFFSANYIKLSVSLMKALPSLALSVLALYFLILAERGSKTLRFYLAIVAGLLVGWAMVVKFWVIGFIPTSNLYLLTRDLRRPLSFRGILNEVKLKIFSQEFLGFNFSWILLVTIILFVINFFDPDQLLSVHFDETISYARRMDMFYLFSPLLKQDRKILIFILGSLSALALDVLSKQKSSLSAVSKSLWIIPSAWLFTDLVLFWNHRPLWFHYYHLFLIPLIWISCYFPLWLSHNLAKTLKSILSKISQSTSSRFFLNDVGVESLKISILIGVLIVSLYGFKGDIISYSNGKAKHWDREPNRFSRLIREIEKNGKPNQIIYTNQPILAVYTNSLIPPEVAVTGIQMSNKDSARLYNERLLTAFQKYPIEQIVLVDATEFPLSDRLRAYISDRYQLLSDRNNILHYKRKSTNNAPSTAPEPPREQGSRDRRLNSKVHLS